MWKHALILIYTALLVRAYEIVNLPIWAHFTRVHEDGGSAAEILPVMSIDTDLSVVVILSVGAPNCFEVEHIEVHVNFILFD